MGLQRVRYDWATFTFKQWQQKQVRRHGRKREFYFRRGKVWFWNTWLQGWDVYIWAGMFTGGLGCRWLLQGAHRRAQQKTEKALTVSASSALCPGSRQFTKTRSCSLTLRARRSCQQSSAQKVQTFLEKKKEENVSITRSQITLVALRQGLFSHSLGPIQERNGRHRSFLHECFIRVCWAACFPAGPWSLFKFLWRERPGILA